LNSAISGFPLLLQHSNGDAILGLLKSMDRLAKESYLFRCFCGPPSATSTKLLSKLKWYDGTIIPYYYETKTIIQKQNQNSLDYKPNACINS